MFCIDLGQTLTEIAKELGMYKLFPNGKNKQKKIEDFYKFDDTDVLVFIDNTDVLVNSYYTRSVTIM